ncbi:type IV pilin [Methanocella sp. MCL-LM]|uniref:type IV pilin n=1 Tax=Methanocella sp. MCL-LM TaxID=3412035 RepID=UPI003C78FEBF
MVRKFAKNDEGVSAVIGVILMVAITVILAAVIAAFVFSMSNGVSKPYTVGITIKKDTAGNIIITNVGGPDVGQLDFVTMSFQKGSSTPAYITVTGTTPAYNATVPTGVLNASSNYDIDALHPVGGSFTIPSSELTSGTQTHVIVTGQFKDGKNQVIGEADV